MCPFRWKIWFPEQSVKMFFIMLCSLCAWFLSAKQTQMLTKGELEAILRKKLCKLEEFKLVLLSRLFVPDFVLDEQTTIFIAAD